MVVLSRWSSTSLPVRRLSAILAADAVGFTARVAANEACALSSLRACLEIVELVTSLHGGRVFKTIGDGLLAEFGSVVNAVLAAAAIQSRLAERNRDLSADGRLDFRMGVHVGDVVADGDDLLGDGVNIAARLEASAIPGEVWISDRVYDDVAGKVDLPFQERGERVLKGVARPIRVFALPGLGSQPASSAVTLALPDKPSLAVLPFTNMSPDPEQEYFVDGLTEDLITGLASVPWLFVIARNSTFTFKGTAVDVRRVGRELGVRYVLEGSVRRAGERLRITGQLVDAESGAHLWAERMDGTLEDVFDLQDRVTEAVVTAIGPHIQDAEIARATAKRPDSLTAYDWMLRAMAALNRAKVPEAMGCLEQALSLAPAYGKALAMLSWCYTLRSAWAAAGEYETNRAEGLALARQALDAAAGDPEVDAYAGYTRGFFAEDLPSALALLRGATDRSPSFSWAWASIAMLEGLHGDPHEAFEACDRAARLNPRDSMAFRTRSARAGAYQAVGDWAGVLSEARAVVAMAPNVVWIWAMIITSLSELGRTTEAREAAAALRERFPDFCIRRMLEVFRRMRNMRGEHADLIEGRLREAGLPE